MILSFADFWGILGELERFHVKDTNIYEWNMDNQDFEAPPTGWVVLTVIGGVATGLGLIASLEYLSDRLSPNSQSHDSTLNSKLVLRRLSNSERASEVFVRH